MTVYLDLVMGLNFAVDFLLLLGTNSLAGFPPGVRRNLWASALGAVYGAGCLLPGMGFLGNSFWRLVFLALMGAAALLIRAYNVSTMRPAPRLFDREEVQ